MYLKKKKRYRSDISYETCTISPDKVYLLINVGWLVRCTVFSPGIARKFVIFFHLAYLPCVQSATDVNNPPDLVIIIFNDANILTEHFLLMTIIIVIFLLAGLKVFCVNLFCNCNNIVQKMNSTKKI